MNDQSLSARSNLKKFGSPALWPWLTAALLSLAGCGDAPPVPEQATAPSSLPVEATDAAPPVISNTVVDPDGPEWARSLPWQAGAPCRAQAQMLYEQIGARLRGMSLEDQMQAYAERDDLGPGSTAMLPQIRAQLERLYAAEPAQLEQLPPAVAAECLALQPPVNVSRDRALACHLQHAHPTYRALYTSAAPPPADQSRTADHQLHRCLRGKI